jgi:hypothetical protein
MIGKRVFLGSTYRNFKDASSLRSEIAKANSFLALGDRKLLKVAAPGRIIEV